MTTFLLLVSFLLHMITLTMIYQLVKQIKSLRDHNHTDTAALMETYLQEIKEENRMLEANLDNTRNDAISLQTQMEGKGIRRNQGDHTPDIPKQDDFIPDTPEAETDLGDTFETSLYARILQLQDQGLSNQEIASQLQCGTTEVELIRKLYPKTNNNA